MEPLASKARLKELHLPSTKDFVLVEVPEMQFVMIDGEGSPQGEQYKHAVKWLFSAIYPIKRIAKEAYGQRLCRTAARGPMVGRRPQRLHHGKQGQAEVANDDRYGELGER